MAYGIVYDPSTGRVRHVARGGAQIQAGPTVMRVGKNELDSTGLSAFLDAKHQLTINPAKLGCDGSMVYEMAETLLEAKARLIPAVDQETSRRIAAGFQINGHTFSLSLQAQSTLRSMWEERTSLSYPVLFPTSDDAEMVSIANQTALESGITKARQAVNDRTQAGRTAKKGILAAADVAEAQSIYEAYLKS